MCIYNQMIKNRKYTKSKKNDTLGYIPTLPDRRVEYVPTGCGNCFECRKQKAREWLVRLMEDIKTHKNGKFITLTFSNEAIKELSENTIRRTNKQSGQIEQIPIRTLKGYDRDNSIATKALRNFNENWRSKYGKAIRHWMVTELGHKGTENIHLHGVMWTNQTINQIREKWIYGWILPKPWDKRPNYVNNASVKYWTKYIHKMDLRNKEYKPIILCSPGIGANYINTIAATKNIKHQTETYKTTTGHEIALPIYWRNKLFSDEDRERLWIKRLDKQERWVDGIKYDISHTEDNYNRANKDARRKNTQLNYGGRPNENRKQNEEQRRDILNETRIRRAQGPASTTSRKNNLT